MSSGVSDKITYTPYTQGGQWLLPPRRDDLVPQNHFVRLVSKSVDELEIEAVFARNTKGGGASRSNPVMLLIVNCLWSDKRQFRLQAISSSGKEKVGIEWGLLMLGYDFKQLIRLMNT